ncbi:hypothetical protein GCM10010145_58040 [Streptomyces ruber]|uniref:Uncharacterized protein n=2 Tax=Streptomyces TaxID=1883 RepID=A0A918BMR7_9ACTN|nr:hypothetical protein GCM10010145_58040 [Streptomyces ruber]
MLRPENLVSRPYVHMSLAPMRRFGAYAGLPRVLAELHRPFPDFVASSEEQC